jgi:cell division protein FtsB
MLKILKEKVKNIGRRSVHLFLLIIIFVLVLSVIRNIAHIRKAGMLLSEEEEKVTALREEQKALRERLEKVQSEEFIEIQLRDSLGMTQEGEIVIILPEDKVVRTFAPKYEVEEASLPDPNWKKWAKLFGLVN